jgi:hypothetical protein
VNPVTIRPHLFRQFGSTEGSTFCLVTNPEITDQLKIEENGAYSSYMSVQFNCGDSFDTLLEEIVPKQAHVLVISPHCLFESPPPEKLGSGRKLIAMPYDSTPATLDSIARFLSVMESSTLISPGERAPDQSGEALVCSVDPPAKRGVMQRKKSPACPCQY